jgi:hypothetical protein
MALTDPARFNPEEKAFPLPDLGGKKGCGCGAGEGAVGIVALLGAVRRPRRPRRGT